jgi:2,3-bisphosphoglycerate-independent phosphoglycerate mutase
VIELPETHPINRGRVARGRPALNVITLKWYGRLRRELPTFLERHGVHGTFVGESAFLRGLAIAVGLETIEAAETADPVADMRGRLALVEERLAAGDTFVFVHQKTTDAAGHTKNPEIKRDTIAALDAALDEVRDRFGTAAVTRAVLLGRDSGFAMPLLPD